MEGRQWLQTLTRAQAAEPLPDADRPRRRDQARDQDPDVLLDGKLELMAGDTLDPEGDDSILEWSAESQPVSQIVAITVASATRVLGLRKRHLPHSKLHDLFWLFQGSWEVLHAASEGRFGRLDVCPSWSSFFRRWQHRWKQVLKFRTESQHSQCSTCFDLQRRMHQRNASWEARMQAAADLKAHYKSQYLDRCLYWSLRFASRADADILTVIIDSMDRTKFAWQHSQDLMSRAGRQSREAQNLDWYKLLRVASQAALAIRPDSEGHGEADEAEAGAHSWHCTRLDDWAVSVAGECLPRCRCFSGSPVCPPSCEFVQHSLMQAGTFGIATVV